MKRQKLILLSILLLSIISCSKNDEQPPEQPPEGSINLSELTTKTDYYLPFAIINDANNISAAFLNGEKAEFFSGDFIKFEETGFYELVLKYKDQGKPDDTILFTTMVKEREAAEWGIREWVPESFESVFPTGAEIEGIYPRHYSDTTDIPFIFYIKESGVIKPVYCEGMSPSTGATFNIKQGVW
jgi:hypothetical protein